MTNHYAPPQSPVTDVSRSGKGGITETMIDALSGTKPWVLLIGIVLFISTAFMVLGSFGMFAAGVMGTQKGGPPAAAMAGLAAMYLVVAVIDVVMGIYLVKYSSAIGRVVQSVNTTDMEDALESQRKFWKFAGILTIIAIAFSVIGMIAAMVIPFLALAQH